jgi:hypothetical protein
MTVVFRTTSDNVNYLGTHRVPKPNPEIHCHEKGYLERTNHVIYKGGRADAINMQVMYTDVPCTRNFYNVSKALSSSTQAPDGTLYNREIK